jgi:hypothetical protein
MLAWPPPPKLQVCGWSPSTKILSDSTSVAWPYWLEPFKSDWEGTAPLKDLIQRGFYEKYMQI